MDNDDLYILYLNSSNIGVSSVGVPVIAQNDSNFTSSIRPLNLNPDSNWVVGVVDVNFFNIRLNAGRPANSEFYPVNIFSDVGIQVRDGVATTDLLYLTNPPKQDFSVNNIYFGEKNTGSIAGWRPIQNKSIQKINMRFIGADGTPIQWDGVGTRGFNSITLAIMKVQ